MRPIYHHNDDRIKAHVFLCMLAYYVQWHMKQRLKPLFDADAKGKNRKFTFDSIILALQAITKNKVSLQKTSFYKITKPSALQAKIIKLLRVSL